MSTTRRTFTTTTSASSSTNASNATEATFTNTDQNQNPSNFEKIQERELKPVHILLYIPNLIGYARIILLLLAYASLPYPSLFIYFYCSSIVLDFFDGLAARNFNQCSSFGAWLDVIVDNASRSLLWSNTVSWGWLIVTLEWVTFVCNHQMGSKWREGTLKKCPSFVSDPPPMVVQKVMENGFKTLLGTWAVLGLHLLPLWIYAMQTGFLGFYLPFTISLLVCVILVGGRALCLAVEIWCIRKHVQELLWEDLDSKNI